MTVHAVEYAPKPTSAAPIPAVVVTGGLRDSADGWPADQLRSRRVLRAISEGRVPIGRGILTEQKRVPEVTPVWRTPQAVPAAAFWDSGARDAGACDGAAQLTPTRPSLKDR